MAGALVSACTPKRRQYTAREAVDAIAAQSSQIKTERGRAWVSVRTPENKISFPAVIAVDRTDPKRPLLRIEAMDPFGSTHALLILDQRAQLTWVDYDNRTIHRVEKDWYGIPLARLPELLLGFMSVPESGRVGAAGPDGFAVREGESVFQYDMEWIDPGPRLAVSGIDGTVRVSRSRRERYIVHYSHFLDKDDFYLPQEATLKGFGAGSADDLLKDKPLVEMNVAWRERRWNEAVPMQVFTVPNGPLEDFTRQ